METGGDGAVETGDDGAVDPTQQAILDSIIVVSVTVVALTGTLSMMRWGMPYIRAAYTGTVARVSGLARRMSRFFRGGREEPVEMNVVPREMVELHTPDYYAREVNNTRPWLSTNPFINMAVDGGAEPCPTSSSSLTSTEDLELRKYLEGRVKSRIEQLEEDRKAVGLEEMDMKLEESDVGSLMDSGIPRGLWRDIDNNRGRLVRQSKFVISPLVDEQEIDERCCPLDISTPPSPGPRLAKWHLEDMSDEEENQEQVSVEKTLVPNVQFFLTYIRN